MTWRPLTKRDAENTSEFDGPHEGVPPWLRASLWDWVATQLDVGQRRPFSIEGLRKLERATHIAAPDPKTLRLILLANEEKFLDAVDYLCSQHRGRRGAHEELDEILTEAGSVWTVDILNKTPHWFRSGVLSPAT